jgi:hypothetical protein
MIDRGQRLGRAWAVPLALVLSAVAAGPAATPAAAPAAAPAPTPAPSSPPADASAAREPRFSADALYNLGNSYARAGRTGLAVLNYERASLLAPNDPDIDANLESVRAASHLPSTPKGTLARLLTIPSAGLVSWLALFGGIVAGAALLAARVWIPYRWVGRGVAVLGIAPMGLAVGHAMALWPTLHAAVVVTNAAPARVTPVPMGDPLFTLPEGETVTLTAQHEQFLLIQTRTGKTGWVSGTEVVPVVPRARLP